MSHTDQSAQRNVERPQSTEASHAMLVQLLYQHVRSFVLTTRQVAEILGKNEGSLRLSESRHRREFGTELLPCPLLQNGDGRLWSIDQIARWLAQRDCSKPTPSPGPEVPGKRRGRPRKGAHAAAEGAGGHA